MSRAASDRRPVDATAAAPGASGFALVDALVALLVAGVMASALYGLMSSSLNASHLGRQALFEAEAAKSLCTELAAQDRLSQGHISRLSGATLIGADIRRLDRAGLQDLELWQASCYPARLAGARAITAYALLPKRAP